MTASTRANLLSLLLCLLLVRLDALGQSQDATAQSTTDWQTISNLTVFSDVVNYQIRSFPIENPKDRHISLAIQSIDVQFDTRLQDMLICGNVVYTLDPNKIYIQPLNPQVFSPVGLYKPKIILQTDETVVFGGKSLSYDWLRKRLFFSKQGRIEMIDFCKQSTQVHTVIRRDGDILISKVAVDPARGVLLWTESADIDHLRVMRASVNGFQVTQLYESNSSQSTAMTIDVQSGQVYWVSRQQLWTVTYAFASGQAKVLLRSENLIADSIQIDPSGNYVYWSTMQRKVLSAPIPPVLLAGEEAKVQLVSQLDGQHLLLLAFKVTVSAGGVTDDGCTPLCQGATKLEKSTVDTLQEGTCNGTEWHLPSSPPPTPPPSTLIVKCTLKCKLAAPSLIPDFPVQERRPRG